MEAEMSTIFVQCSRCRALVENLDELVARRERRDKLCGFMDVAEHNYEVGKIAELEDLRRVLMARECECYSLTQGHLPF
jgi:hypothetical protein